MLLQNINKNERITLKKSDKKLWKNKPSIIEVATWLKNWMNERWLTNRRSK